ncbi:MAG: NAD-dependent epimerase/dehydratase family protein [Anaerolineae bacterium]|nr:MAG: NAD-dependent epimerase/dehydratase family protein [Anaerolineae bacterium]
MYAITGATAYTGKYITRRLLQRGGKILNLTGHPQRPNPFGERVQSVPFAFDNPQRMAAQLNGVKVLFNTYWVRFSRGRRTFAQAEQNTLRLFEAARLAGVRRVVHVSITNPAPDSPLPYFSGKARLEAALQESGLSYAILRPAVLFGREDILINNIAYFLRRFPLFAIPGSGDYRLQPIFVDDFAALAVRLAFQEENIVLDAVGPETFTFNELVSLLGRVVGSRARIIHVSPRLAYWMTRALGLLVHDVVLTRQEIIGLMSDLLVTESPPAGQTALSQWAQENAATLGRTYASELRRHYRS